MLDNPIKPYLKLKKLFLKSLKKSQTRKKMKLIGGVILCLIGLFGLLFFSDNNDSMLSAINSGQRGASVALAGADTAFYKQIFFFAALLSGAWSIYEGFNIKKCGSCLSEMPKKASKCAKCGSDTN